MNRILSKYINKLYVMRWEIGVCRFNKSDLINSGTFNPNIKWFHLNYLNVFHADPFLLRSGNENINILFEEYSEDDKYGKISIMGIDENFNQLNYKKLLDTKSHLSYPFVFEENNKTYVFPESSKSGKLSCYEYDHENVSFNFLKEIIDLPLLDSTIVKRNNKYWIFGIMNMNDVDYKLYIFFSDNLLGPYEPHSLNPIKNGLNGTRPAGNFIVINDQLYRPTQNCENRYGESITINKVNVLDEVNFEEEPYMPIYLNQKNNYNIGMRTIHTINILDDIMVVDGENWIYSPLYRLKRYLKKKIPGKSLNQLE